METPVTDIFAHRGSWHLARENTVEAFAAARDLGADGVELDVRRTSDGEVVVHHDAEVAGVGPIAQLTSAELPEWLPTLGEALDASRSMLVNVEVKRSGNGRGTEDDDLLALEVASVLDSRSDAPRIVVSSFSLAIVDVVRSSARSLATALLVGPAEDPFRALATAVEHGHGGMHPFFESVDDALVKAAKAAHVAIRTWTVDDPDRIAALGALGVDAVITNDVAAARGALGRTDGTVAMPDP